MRLIPHTRSGSLWRFLLAAMIIVCSTAAATAVAGLLQFKQLASDVGVSPPIPGANVTLPNPGEPQTLLVIGSDHRAGTPFRSANTDTMLLVRLNANSSTINLLSIPRDLEVQVPGFGMAKLNSAYADGGPNLLIKTIQQNVFSAFHPNHIVDVNFGAFQHLVEAIGCVYADVDHRYYNDTRVTGYSSIDIQAGYQKLCGASEIRGALAFVRFRHSDSDLVRNARQQAFIRWAKDQYGVSNLLSNRDALLRIFGRYAATDRGLHSVDGLINLFSLVLNSAGHTIKQIKFPGTLQPCLPATPTGTPPCYVTSNPNAEARAFRDFLRPTTAAAAAKSASAKQLGAARRSAKIQTAGLADDSADGKSQALALSRAGMPVYYPRLVVSGSSYCSTLAGNCPLEIPSPGSYPRAYQIRDRQGHPHAAYRMTLQINPLQGQYYGVQGTAWQDPPLLANPSGARVVAGKTLLLYANGGKLTTVAWRTAQGVYWISNTLTSDIPNRQMVSIAASLTRAG